MPADTAISVGQTQATPLTYTLPSAQDVVLHGARASYDGTGAAGSFVPLLQILAPGGLIVSEAIGGATLAAGASADLSWFPRVGGGGGGAITTQTLVAYAVFAPVGGSLSVTSTNNAAPTNVITTPSFTADGATQYRIDFGVSALDIKVTAGGSGTATLLTLTRDSTILGDVMDYNVQPTNGLYGSIPVFLSVFDTPPAGSHTYSIGAFLSDSGGATHTSLIYGSGLGPPFVGVTHPGYIAVLKTVVA